MCLKFLEKFDMYAIPVTVSYKGKQDHRQWIGGLMSVIVVMFVIIYLNWRLQVMFSYERDEYMMCSFFTDFNDRDPY